MGAVQRADGGIGRRLRRPRYRGDGGHDVAVRARPGVDGVYFYPPLGPEPTPAGAFDATLLDGVSVTIDAVDAAGDATTLASFDQTTQPAVALLGPQERYWVNIPAATYVTDPSKVYRIHVLLDGTELGTSTLSNHIFTVLAYNPSLPIGVHVRIEGSGAVRAVHRTTLQTHGAPAHCSDGRRNKDEAGVDCGGSCAPCPTCTDGIQNQGEAGVDCGGPCAPCPTCSDGIQNQGEAGVDCGGPCARACASCSDHVQNQGETGIDCGGPCAPCALLINVTSATYGASCGVGAGNVTGSVAGSCNGRRSCAVYVSNSVFGDPTPGCPKDFRASYTCGGAGSYSASHGPAVGEGYTVTLSCP